MISNYLKIAIRLLFKNKIYSLIHLTGLSIGLWACLMITTVVIDDLSYDKHWTRYKDIYRIISVNKMAEGEYDRSASSFLGLAPQLQKIYPEIESFSTFSTRDLHFKLKEGDASDIKTAVLNADTSVLNILDLKILQGDPGKYQPGISNLVISESFRDKFFKGRNPVGQTIYNISGYDKVASPFLITGVIKDLPYNSHLRADLLWLRKGRTEDLSEKEFGSLTRNYVLMKPGTDVAKFTKKVNSWYANFVGNKGKYQYEFQPMEDVYLHSDFDSPLGIKGSIKNIYIFSAVAILLLLIACFNFVNLTTARTFSRLRETGVRKILSATRYHIMFQLISEALLLFLVSGFLAILFYQLSIKPVEMFLGHQLTRTLGSDFIYLSATVPAVLLTGFFAGLYPAWLISGLKPANTLRGVFSSGRSWLKESLVVFQFSISIVVFLAMMVVRQQLSFMSKKDLGFNQNNLLYMDNVSWDGKSKAFKEELLRLPGVESASITGWLPTQGAGSYSRDVEDPSNSKNKVKVWTVSGDVDLIPTLGLKLVSGRGLSSRFALDAINSDSLQEVSWEKFEMSLETQNSVITESAAKILKVSRLNERISNAHSVPVGIVKDFNNESLYEEVKPVIITASKDPQYGGMLIRAKAGSEGTITAAVQGLWKKFYPYKLLEIGRVDDLIKKQYEREARLSNLFTIFSSLTMFLSALGIFGLAVQASEQRTREIGIRKVLGASAPGIVRLLSGDFLILVIIALFIASPVGWWLMSHWLKDFAYRIEMEWWVYITAGLVTVTIAVLTVCSQAVRVAFMNPVKSLRSE